MRVKVIVTDDKGQILEGEAALQPSLGAKKRPRRSVPGIAVEKVPDRSVDVVALVERLNDSEEYAQIEANVLNNRGALPRLMLCLYLVREDPSPYLSSSEMEKVTNQLGVRVFQNNVGRIIGENLKYFTADSVRAGRGTKPKYKLNRAGLAAFLKLLKGEKL